MNIVVFFFKYFLVDATCVTVLSNKQLTVESEGAPQVQLEQVTLEESRGRSSSIHALQPTQGIKQSQPHHLMTYGFAQKYGSIHLKLAI